MTIHAAKGLEFQCVIVGGLEETLFPNSMSINTSEELEEERRLFYVAITRAKKKLWLTYANARYRFGQLQQNDPSRFLEELPDEYVDRSFAGGGINNQGMRTGWGGSGRQSTVDRRPSSDVRRPVSDVRPTYTTPSARPQMKEHVPSADFKPSD